MSKYDKWDSILTDYFQNASAEDLIKDSARAGIRLSHQKKVHGKRVYGTTRKSTRRTMVEQLMQRIGKSTAIR